MAKKIITLPSGDAFYEDRVETISAVPRTSMAGEYLKDRVEIGFGSGRV